MQRTIFGRVSSGMGVVERLGGVVTGANDRPREDVRINAATPNC